MYTTHRTAGSLSSRGGGRDGARSRPQILCVLEGREKQKGARLGRGAGGTEGRFRSNDLFKYEAAAISE